VPGGAANLAAELGKTRCGQRTSHRLTKLYHNRSNQYSTGTCNSFAAMV